MPQKLANLSASCGERLSVVDMDGLFFCFVQCRTVLGAEASAFRFVLYWATSWSC
jgi:hypothetical protein